MLAGLGDLGRRLSGWLAAAVLFACALPALASLRSLGQILRSRVDYPMDLEWMEGGVLLHAHRLLEGKALYGPPSLGFLPFPYPPGHYLALALAGASWRLDYATGRALSLAFLVLGGAVVADELMHHFRYRREGVAAVLLAAGFIAVGFPVVGGWYDIIRNDTMAIALPLCAAALLRDGRASHGRILWASLALTLGIYTKQTGALFALWLCLFQLSRSRRRGFFLCTATGVQSLAALAILQRLSDGWFWIYAIRNISRHPVITERAYDALHLLLVFAPYVVLVPVLVLLLRRRLRARTVKWVGMFVWSLPVSLLPFMKAGGFSNNLLPMVILAGPATLFLVGDLANVLWRRGPSLRWRALPTVVLFCAFAIGGYYLTQRPIPAEGYAVTPAQRLAAQRLNAWIATLDGGVVIPNHPFLAVRNGIVTEQIHEMAYEDAIGGQLRGLDLMGWLERTDARWVIVSGMENAVVTGWIHSRYRHESPVPVMVPTVTGFRSAPRYLLKRLPEIVPRRRRILFDFERGLEGWTLRGLAFEEHAIDGGPENRILTSWHARIGDAAVGRAVSPAFVIDRDHLGLLLGGGRAPSTRVELIVDEQVMRRATGVNSDVLVPVTWDLHDLVGSEGRLAVVDEATGYWGHVMVDEVALFDAERPLDPPADSGRLQP